MATCGKQQKLLKKLCDRLKVQWVHVDNTNWRDLAEIFRQSKVFFLAGGMHRF